jgi:hypothetical protein
MKKSYALGFLASALLALTATADIIPSLSNITSNAGGFAWNYSASVTNDEMLQSTNFFTIYDFSNIAPASITAPAGWSFTTSLVGQTPSRVNPIDSASFYNVTFTYSGATVNGAAALGTFSIESNTNALRVGGNFAAQAVRNSGPDAGTTIDNVGTLAVPVPEMSALAPLIGVCGCGAIGLVTAALRRRQSQA